MLLTGMPGVLLSARQMCIDLIVCIVNANLRVLYKTRLCVQEQ